LRANGTDGSLDSPLEGSGFEPSVPLDDRNKICGRGPATAVKRHCAGRRLLRIGTPIIRRHREPGWRCLRALAKADGAETPVRYPRLQFDHRRMKPAGVSDTQHHPSSRHRIERSFSALHVEGKRLFHEDVLAGRRGALDMGTVLAVRRCKHNRIDCRVGEDPL
jgi:hypothetical protein